jgi:hypothetical protein
MSTSRLNEEESEPNPARPVRSVLTAGIGQEATLASSLWVSKEDSGFALQESGPEEGQERPRRVASALEQSNHHKRVSTMRPTHDVDTQPLSDDVSSGRATLRSGETVHTTVPETVRRHKSNDGTVSSRTVTRYDATLQKQYLNDQSSRTSPIYLSETAQTSVLDMTISCPKCGNTEKTQRNELSNELSIY